MLSSPRVHEVRTAPTLPWKKTATTRLHSLTRTVAGTSLDVGIALPSQKLLARSYEVEEA